MNEIIEEVASGKSKSLNNTTRDEIPATVAETSERSISRDIDKVQPAEKWEFLISEVDEIVEVILGMDQSEECGEQCVEQEGEELIWEDDIIGKTLGRINQRTKRS